MEGIQEDPRMGIPILVREEDRVSIVLGGLLERFPLLPHLPVHLPHLLPTLVLHLRHDPAQPPLLTGEP